MFGHKQKLIAASLAGLLALAPLLPARAACDLPLPPAANTPALPHVAAAIAPAEATLRVLAVGSATVLGVHGGVPGSFPAAMVQALEAARPGLSVRLTVHGVRGQSAEAMLAVLRDELAAGEPAQGPVLGGPFQLVLWQTGTVEAVRRMAPDAFEATLRKGAEMVHAAGADLIFVDPQFTRLLGDRADLAPYRRAMLAVLGTPGTAMLDRYQLMRNWADAGVLDLDATPKPQRAAVMLRVQRCMGEMTARRVLAGAATAAAGK